MLFIFIRHHDLRDVLTKLSSSINTEERPNILNVLREDVLDAGLRAFAKDTFRQSAPLNVKFVGEDGIDNGGPSREFMRLAMRGIHRMSIFEGPDDKRQLTLDYACE